jgi:hypothetical protein
VFDSPEPVQRTDITLALAGNRATTRRLFLSYIEAAIPTQYQAGYKLKWDGDYGFKLGY